MIAFTLILFLGLCTLKKLLRKLGNALEVSPIIFALDPENELHEIPENMLISSPEISRIVAKLIKLPPDKLKILESVLDSWVDRD